MDTVVGKEGVAFGVATLLELLEHAPVAAYLSHAVGDELLLEAVSAHARAISPALANMIGRNVLQVYGDQRELLANIWRSIREKTTIVAELRIRRHERVEANQLQRLTYVYVAPDRCAVFAEDLERHDNAAAALAESEERYRSLIASVPDAVLVRGNDGRVVACNDVAVELCGHREQADLLGKTEILAPSVTVIDEAGENVHAKDLPSLHAARSGGRVRGRLFTQFRTDGSRRFVRLSVEPIVLRNGEVGGSVALYADETDRISAERAQKESAERLAFALDAARMGTWEWSPSNDDGRWSPSLYRIFDIEGTGSGFANFLSRVHPDDFERHERARRQARNRARGRNFRARVSHRGQRRRHALGARSRPGGKSRGPRAHGRHRDGRH
ncbi:MAG: PAS domain S-box protein [Polyangiaceae bacterium]